MPGSATFNGSNAILHRHKTFSLHLRLYGIRASQPTDLVGYTMCTIHFFFWLQFGFERDFSSKRLSAVVAVTAKATATATVTEWFLKTKVKNHIWMILLFVVLCVSAIFGPFGLNVNQRATAITCQFSLLVWKINVVFLFFYPLTQTHSPLNGHFVRLCGFQIAFRLYIVRCGKSETAQIELDSSKVYLLLVCESAQCLLTVAGL